MNKSDILAYDYLNGEQPITNRYSENQNFIEEGDFSDFEGEEKRNTPCPACTQKFLAAKRKHLALSDGKRRDYSSLDGEVVEMDYLNGEAPITKRYTENNNFAEEGDFYQADGEDHSNYFGEGLVNAFSNTFGAKARLRKAKRKASERKYAAKETARLAKETAQDDAQLSSLLAQTGKPAIVGGSKPMSTGAKVGIALGVTALLGGIGFAIFKLSKK